MAEGKAFQFDTRMQEVYGFKALYGVHYDWDTGIHRENGGESRDKTEESCRRNMEEALSAILRSLDIIDNKTAKPFTNETHHMRLVVQLPFYR